MRSLEANLAVAQMVVSVVRLPRGNIPADVRATDGGSASCFSALRADLRRRWDGQKPSLEFWRDVALRAEERGCGNCGEHAAIVFFHIVDAFGGPVAYVGTPDGATVSMPNGFEGDHAFVVVGPANLAFEYEHSAEFGPDAAVADAWARQAYPATEIEAQLGYAGPFICRLFAA